MPRQTSLPIVAYHQVRPGGRMTPALFGEHLRALRAGGWESVGTDEVYAFLKGEPLPRRARVFALTFDDGYLDNWLHAFPLLRAQRARATIYLVTGRTGGPGKPRTLPEASAEVRPGWELNHYASLHPGPAPGFLNAAEIAEMAGSGLVSFGTHSHRHAPCFTSAAVVGRLRGKPEWWLESLLGRKPALREPLHPWDSALVIEAWQRGPRGGKGRMETRKERRARVAIEIAESRAAFQAVCGHEPHHFAYPWGRFDPVLTASLRESGFRTAVTMERGANRPGDDPLLLRRFDAKGHGARWLLARLELHSRAIPARLYGVVHPRKRRIS